MSQEPETRTDSELHDDGSATQQKPVRQVVLWVLGLGAAACLVAVIWPPLHTRWIILRLKREVERHADSPLIGLGVSLGAVSSQDPPERVLDALWMVAATPSSTAQEQQAAWVALAHLQMKKYDYFVRTGWTCQDWDDAMEMFFTRWRADPAPGDPTLAKNFAIFEAKWRSTPAPSRLDESLAPPAPARGQ